MTRDEAIFAMEYYKLHLASTREAIEAFDVAIKALEQEPCEDCISRKEALKIMDWGWKKGIYPSNKIAALSSVAPKSKTGWIPVSERLPEKGKQVLCCNKSGSVFTSAITYINSNGMVAFGQHYEVIAWMPLPEPYKEG